MFGRKIHAKLPLDKFSAVIVIWDACKFGFLPEEMLGFK